MPRLGELPPDHWTDQLRKSGRAVFHTRRRQYVALSLLSLAFAGRGILRLSTGPAAIDWIFTGFGSAAVVVCVVLLLTGRPVLTVDQTGITFGRRALRWDEIARIGDAYGPRLNRALDVIPISAGTAPLTVGQFTVKDVEALAAWLTERLHDHRGRA